MANRIVHAEVVGKDAGALQRFFSELFGWKVDTNNPGGYGMFSAEDAGLAGGIGSTPDGSAGHVTFYVSVPSIDRTLQKAEQLGGRTVMPKTEPAPGTKIALLADPEGHVVGLSEA